MLTFLVINDANIDLGLKSNVLNKAWDSQTILW